MSKPFVKCVEERRVPEKMSDQRVPNVLIRYTAAAREIQAMSIKNTECLLRLNINVENRYNLQRSNYFVMFVGVGGADSYNIHHLVVKNIIYGYHT